MIFGTAPINQAADPKKAVNRPVKATTFEEAKKALGYSDDWEKYTLCQSMYASFQLFQTSPVIFVNVLDPDTHVKSLENYPAKVENHQAVVKEPGILLTGLTIKAQVSGSITGQARTGQAKVASGLKELIAGTDYLAQLDDNGKLVVTLLSKGDAYEVSEIQMCIRDRSIWKQRM